LQKLGQSFGADQAFGAKLDGFGEVAVDKKRI
jgi:hypothetical protein